MLQASGLSQEQLFDASFLRGQYSLTNRQYQQKQKGWLYTACRQENINQNLTRPV
jgi:hypothetical protein